MLGPTDPGCSAASQLRTKWLDDSAVATDVKFCVANSAGVTGWVTNVQRTATASVNGDFRLTDGEGQVIQKLLA